MRARFTKIAVVAAVAAAMIFGLCIHAAALDDTYTFDDLGMSIKFPKSDYVITRQSERSDEVFSQVDLDYDETMTAFHAANIYLRAYEPEGLYQISMTVISSADTAAINNYADLTAAERKSILDAILSDSGVSSAVEIKHNSNIFFDSSRETSVGGETVYINQCNTIINGYQIDLTLQKSDEAITPEEAKALTNAANSLSFEKIRRNTGPVFDWWRLLLWAGLLVVISVLISLLYKRNNSAGKRKLEERRSARRAALEQREAAPDDAAAERPMSFDEALGYRDDEEFTARADADEMAGYDISVREKDPAKGIAFFEDEGDSIDDGTDYFDTYFEEPVEKRSVFQKLYSAINTYIMIGLTHIGYFFKNLYRKLFGKKKK